MGSSHIPWSLTNDQHHHYPPPLPLPHHPRPAGCGRLPRTWSTWTPGSPGNPPSLPLTHFHWLSARYFFTFPFPFQLCLSFEQVFRVGYNLPGPLGQYSLLAKVTEMEETKWDSRKQLELNKHLSFYLQRKIVLEAENFLSPKITAVFSQVCHHKLFFLLISMLFSEEREVRALNWNCLSQKVLIFLFVQNDITLDFREPLYKQWFF